jgi:hypothetical protein
MSAVLAQKPKAATGTALDRARVLLRPLNLHWAGVVLLALVNLYLLAQMALLWHSASNHSTDAFSQQHIALRTAEIAAQPLRGLDAKLARSTDEADKFSRQRLPASDSEVAAELGVLTKKENVRLTRAQYPHAPALAGTADELTEVRIEATLSGDYRSLVEFINSLERDKLFFVVTGVTLTSQQSGTVSLGLRLTTYERRANSVPPSAATQLPIHGSGSSSNTTGGAR